MKQKIEYLQGLRGPSKALVLASRFAALFGMEFGAESGTNSGVQTRGPSADRKKNQPINETGCILLVTQTAKSQEELIGDLELFLPANKIFPITSWETIPFEPVSPSLAIQAERIYCLDALANGKPGIYVASVEALSLKTLPRKYVSDKVLALKINQSIAVDSVLTQLISLGFKKARLVEAKGEYTAQGNIVDFFPGGRDKPVRLEFSGSKLNSLRIFDPETQRSLEEITSATILPVLETRLHTKPELNSYVDRIKERALELETPPSEIAKIVESFSDPVMVPGFELYDRIAFEAQSMFAYLNIDTKVILDEPLALERVAEELQERITAREESLSAEHFLIPAPDAVYLTKEKLLTELNNRAAITINDLVNIDSKQRTTFHSSGITPLQIQLKTKVGSGQALDPLRQFLKRLRLADSSVAFVVATTARAERLKQWLAGIDIEANVFDNGALEWLQVKKQVPVVIVIGTISTSVEIKEFELALIAEQDIFNGRSLRSKKKKAISLKRLMSALAELAIDDFVVHVDYGIAKYCGLKHLNVDGVENDFLHLQYADSTLYVPVHNIGKIHKFSSQEGKEPHLDKLSGTRWDAVKAKVKQVAVTLAGDLLRLYASRAATPGWRFDPEGAEDERFAEEFPYDETPDQDKTIHETLADMASEKPMDRLVCGDVGFGKTEVAIRAAFKCTQHARQVAVLVPTTILADQHYQNFKNRLEPFGVRVGVVSRFYTGKENKETLEKLGAGQYDVIVGTHRILSKDVTFHDLGLMVIDEEHRFGVAHKERLKSLKKQVDCLTLTATPIPRTLHMSLLGIRDISVITTPPADRMLIRTYTAQYEATLVSEALRRELARGGQAFYLHNAIDSIPTVMLRLQELVPEGRFAFAHGQMNEEELEDIMHRFLKHEIDCLISTTIIESGIDIPNANTIIIERADMFGLAQLYQLRGRVGRSNKQAYAYFLIPKARKISHQARERLQALQSLDELGVGFNLAIRDLEIRGAGNLLGKEQSGSLHSVGFELYTKILKEAIANMKGEDLTFAETIEPDIKLPVEAYIPEGYIPDVSERLLLYQRLSSLVSREDAVALTDEMQDRYGTIPRETLELVSLMELRSYIRQRGIVALEHQRGRLYLRFSPKTVLNTAYLLQLQQKKQMALRITGNYGFSFEFETTNATNSAEVFSTVDTLLNKLVVNSATPQPRLAV